MRLTAATSQRLAATALALALAVTLGLTDARPSAAAQASAAPMSAAASAAATALPSVPSAEDAANAAQNLTLLNEARAEDGLAALTLHSSLAANAPMWSTTMAALDDFVHNPSGFTEIKSLGWSGAGESIARIGWAAPARARRSTSCG